MHNTIDTTPQTVSVSTKHLGISLRRHKYIRPFPFTANTVLPVSYVFHFNRRIVTFSVFGNHLFHKVSLLVIVSEERHTVTQVSIFTTTRSACIKSLHFGEEVLSQIFIKHGSRKRRRTCFCVCLLFADWCWTPNWWCSMVNFTPRRCLSL